MALATDKRANAYAGSFPADEIDRNSLRDAVGPLRAADGEGGAPAGAGTRQGGLRLIRRLRPAVVVGFGGYPTVPPVIAASLLRVPTRDP